MKYSNQEYGASGNISTNYLTTSLAVNNYQRVLMFCLYFSEGAVTLGLSYTSM